jgi:cell division protein FtsN
MRRLSDWRHTESFLFVVTTAALALVVGTAAFFVGRGWIGRYMAQQEQQAPKASIPASPANAEGGQQPTTPGTMSPRVVIREREPSEAEKQALVSETGEQPTGSATASAEGASPVPEGENQPMAPTGPSTSAPDKPPAAPAPGADTTGATGSGSRPPLTGSGGGVTFWAATAGSYRDRSNADRVVSSLKDQGLDADVEQTTVRGRTFYRVRAGRFSSRDDAEAAGRKVQGAGYPSTVVPTR